MLSIKILKIIDKNIPIFITVTNQMPFLLASYNQINDSIKNFVVFGAYNTVEEAKHALNALSPIVMEDRFENITLYEIDQEKNKVYTFEKSDLSSAYKIHQELHNQTLMMQKNGKN